MRMEMKQLKELRNQDGEDNLSIFLLPEDGFKMPPVFDPIVSCIDSSLLLLGQL